MQKILKKLFELNSKEKVYSSRELLLIVYLLINSNKQGIVIDTTLAKIANAIETSTVTVIAYFKKLKANFSIKRGCVWSNCGHKLNSYDISGLLKKLGE